MYFSCAFLEPPFVFHYLELLTEKNIVANFSRAANVIYKLQMSKKNLKNWYQNENMITTNFEKKYIL